MPRYFGARQARAERNRSLKRLRLGHALEGPQGRAEQEKALKKLRLGHALEGTQGFKDTGPAKLSLPLPVFIPLEQASKQVRASATVVSALFYAINREELQQAKEFKTQKNWKC